MSSFNQIVDKSHLAKFATAFKAKIVALIPTKLSQLTNDDSTVKDASYVHTDNNYTAAEKNKLAGIAAGAQTNVIETVKVNGTALSPTSKAVNISVPTGTLASLNEVAEANLATALASKINGKANAATSLSGYGITDAYTKSQTDSKLGTKANTATTLAGYGITDAYTKAQMDSKINALTKLNFSVVTQLPTTGVTGTFYLVAHGHSDAGDSYDEYVWITDTTKTAGGYYEKIGNTDVDLSGYVKTSDITIISEDDVTSLVNAAFA